MVQRHPIQLSDQAARTWVLKYGAREEVGEVAVEDGALVGEPAQEGHASAELVNDEDVRRGMAEADGEGEGKNEVELAKDGADEGEFASDGHGKDRIAHDADFDGPCLYFSAVIAKKKAGDHLGFR
jgi:hypothetical protein